MVNRTFRSKSETVWIFSGVYMINRILHGGLAIQNFSSRDEKYFTRLLHSFARYFQHSERNFVSPRSHILYLRVWWIEKKIRALCENAKRIGTDFTIVLIQISLQFRYETNQDLDKSLTILETKEQSEERFKSVLRTSSVSPYIQDGLTWQFLKNAETCELLWYISEEGPLTTPTG